MGPKKDKKGKSKKKKKKEKPPKILKSEYLAKIAEQNALLAAARKRIQIVEDTYYSTEKKYEQTQEDLADIIKYLEHEIEENELEIAEFDEKITNSKTEIAKNDKYYQSILDKLETDYLGKEKELHDQFQQNAAKLSAFEDVRQQREEYLKKKEALYQKIKEMQARHEKEIYDADKQDTMQTEMEYNINKLVTDFRQATDIAIIINTNKLIRDNIALGNALTCTQEIFEKTRDSYYKIYELEKQYRYNAELLDEEHHMVMKKHLKQVNCIENLLKSQEELCEKIKICERLIGENRRFRREIAEKECILKEKDAELSYLEKVLKERSEIFDMTKTVFNLLRKKVINLEMSLYEAAKCVKSGVDAENFTAVLDDNGLNVETAKDEQEETLKELKYKIRETAIEETIDALKKGHYSNAEMRLLSSSSEYNLPSNTDSNSSNTEPIRISSLV